MPRVIVRLTELLTAPVRAALFLIRGERQLAHARARTIDQEHER